MRLGAYPARLEDGSHLASAYGTKNIDERHRHRYEFNNSYREALEGAGMKASATNPELDLVEAVEVAEHPYFVGVQFHPEYKSKPLAPHPLFKHFIGAALAAKGERVSDEAKGCA
jgi:CTP synthase